MNFLVIEYVESNNLKKLPAILRRSPGEIEFGTGRVSEGIRIRIMYGDKYMKGEVGEEMATKIFEVKLKAMIIDEAD
ncbi:MAG: hypothetical protein ACUVTL_09715 [Thermoproteota archaeon]